MPDGLRLALDLPDAVFSFLRRFFSVHVFYFIFSLEFFCMTCLEQIFLMRYIRTHHHSILHSHTYVAIYEAY